MAREKTRPEKLHSAAVLRRSFELRGEEHAGGFRYVYDGVLRDLGLEDGEVVQYLKEHLAEIEQAIGRKG